MKKTKSCFFCGTSFHVFNSVILAKTKNLYADIYIDDVFGLAKTIAENLKVLGVFENVYLLDRKEHWKFPDNTFSQYLFALKGYWKFDKMIPKIIPNIEVYSDFYFANDPRTDVFGRFIRFYIVKNLINFKIHFFDDGLGSYDERMYEPTAVDVLARKFFLFNTNTSFDSDYFFHSPEYFHILNENSKMKVYPIGEINDEIKDLLKKVFYIEDIGLEIQSNIIFDTVRNEEFNTEGSKVFSTIIGDILHLGNFLVKSHPREKEKYGKEYSIEYGMPFELFCLYNDFSDKVFVTSLSSAVFTPKIIFNQEPKVIFLFEIMKKYSKLYDNMYKRYVKGLEKLYSNKNRVIVCDSIEDCMFYCKN